MEDSQHEQQQELCTYKEIRLQLLSPQWRINCSYIFVSGGSNPARGDEPHLAVASTFVVSASAKQKEGRPPPPQSPKTRGFLLFFAF